MLVPHPPREHRRIETERLLLRPFQLRDKPDLVREIGSEQVHATTLLIPHPYTDDDADEWIAHQSRAWDQGHACNFAIVLRETERLVGGIGLSSLSREHRKGELGFWLGVDHWNAGLMTEAAHAVLGFGFSRLGLGRIWAGHFVTNPASGRVQEKIGMRFEGTLRQDVIKNGVPLDHHMFAILAHEYDPDLLRRAPTSRGPSRRA